MVRAKQTSKDDWLLHQQHLENCRNYRGVHLSKGQQKSNFMKRWLNRWHYTIRMLDTQETRWSKNTCGRDELVEANIGYLKNPKNKKRSHQIEARTKRDNSTKNTDEKANMVRTCHKNEDNTDPKYGVTLQHRGKPNKEKTKKTVDRKCRVWPRRRNNIKIAEALEMVRDRREWRLFAQPHRRSSVTSWWKGEKKRSRQIWKKWW